MEVFKNELQKLLHSVHYVVDLSSKLNGKENVAVAANLLLNFCVIFLKRCVQRPAKRKKVTISPWMIFSKKSTYQTMKQKRRNSHIKSKKSGEAKALILFITESLQNYKEIGSDRTHWNCRTHDYTRTHSIE